MRKRAEALQSRQGAAVGPSELARGCWRPFRAGKRLQTVASTVAIQAARSMTRLL